MINSWGQCSVFHLLASSLIIKEVRVFVVGPRNRPLLNLQWSDQLRQLLVTIAGSYPEFRPGLWQVLGEVHAASGLTHFPFANRIIAAGCNSEKKVTERDTHPVSLAGFSVCKCFVILEPVAASRRQITAPDLPHASCHISPFIFVIGSLSWLLLPKSWWKCSLFIFAINSRPGAPDAWWRHNPVAV